MAHVVKYHPSLNLLEQYCDGTLVSDVALIVAAHLDFCPHCQSLRHDIEADLACQLAQQSVSPQQAAQQDSSAWEQMMAQIIEAPQVNAAELRRQQSPRQTTLQVGSHQFTLPRSVQRLAEKRNKWLNFGGISTAKLPAGDGHHLSLLCIETNTQVPLHTHKGMEITLVLAGEMVDEMGHYAAGDLIINTPEHTHTPRNISAEPCLCLSVLTAPLEFKQGLTRLLNPLQRFFY